MGSPKKSTKMGGRSLPQYGLHALDTVTTRASYLCGSASQSNSLNSVSKFRWFPPISGEKWKCVWWFWLPNQNHQTHFGVSPWNRAQPKGKLCRIIFWKTQVNCMYIIIDSWTVQRNVVSNFVCRCYEFSVLWSIWNVPPCDRVFCKYSEFGIIYTDISCRLCWRGSSTYRSMPCWSCQNQITNTNW